LPENRWFFRVEQMGPGGHMTTPDDLRYSMDSIRALEELCFHLRAILRERAAEKTLREGRTIVTGEDVFAVVGDVLREGGLDRSV
jgi:histone H3/H4